LQEVSYTPSSTKKGAQQITNQPTKFMKTNTLQLTLAAATVASLPLVAVTTVAVAVSYLAVALLVAVAVVDYRQGPKSYAAR
jgi:hypothetical protein